MTNGSAVALRSTVTNEGTVRLTIEPFDIPQPGPDEVVIEVEASPINPSDLGMLLAGADPSTVQEVGEGPTGAPILELKLSPGALVAVQARVDRGMPVGNEGAGRVVAAGNSKQAQALDGRLVAVLAGGMYATHRKAKATDCLALPEGTAAADAASCFVNPLTALGMTETMRREGHTAVVHTAAASNLGQMLGRICNTDGIDLVNIVRRAEQEALLRDQGQRFVVNSSADTFTHDLRDALVETGATIAFDAIGGGEQAADILTAMEAAAAQGGGDYNRYGSSTHKQVYIYGGLDRSPTILDRRFGMAWSVGGWLLPPFLEQIGADRAGELRQRVVDELTTTFASTYTETVSLAGMLDPQTLTRYSAMATGQKVLVEPSPGRTSGADQT